MFCRIYLPCPPQEKDTIFYVLKNVEGLSIQFKEQLSKTVVPKPGYIPETLGETFKNADV